MNWTPETAETAKTLWLAGSSASEIAAHLGDGATRNAVLGKLHRMKLTGPAAEPRQNRIVVKAKKPKAEGAPRTGATKARMAQIRKSSLPHAPAYADRFGDPETDPQAELEAERAALRPDAWEPLPWQPVVPIVALDREGQCRWPIGDPREAGFGFCGAVTHGDTVYCRTHALRAWPALRGEPVRTRADAERGKFKTLALR